MGQPDFRWTPPTDAVPIEKGGWKPPADAIPLVPKKKSGAGSPPISTQSGDGSSPSPLQQSLTNAMKAYSITHTPKEVSDVQSSIQQQQQEDKIKATPKDVVEHEKYMETPLGKTQAAFQYVGSKASKGALQIAKGATWLYNHAAANPLQGALQEVEGPPKAQTDFFKKADQITNLGLTATDQQNIENAKGLGGNALKTAGMIAEFAPAMAGGELAGIPKTAFAIQGFGQGQETMDAVDPDHKVNPVVRDAFIAGSGTVNGLLMGDLGENLFGKMPAGVRKNIVTGIVADALKSNGEKALTEGGFKELLNNGAKDFADKFTRSGISALEKYNKTAVDLSAFSLANSALKKGVDLANDKPVFNETASQAAQGVEDAITKQAPMLSAFGSVPEITKLTPYSNFKNDIVESVVAKPEQADIIKSQIEQHGANNGWSPEEIQATNDHVTQIAEAAKRVPDTIKPEKKADAVQLVLDRGKLDQELKAEQAKKMAQDPAFHEMISPREEYLTDKIDQANDKLKAMATGKRTTYSKGVGDEEGKFFKTTDGKQEDITENRYNLENLERTSKNQDNESEQKSSNEQTTKGESVAEQPNNPTEVGESIPESSSQNEERLLTTGGEQPPLNQEENAAKIESTGKVDVGEQAGNGETVGERNTEPESPAEQGQKEEGEVKKTILTKRAYEGEIQPEVKKHLEEKGLTRKSFSQEERSEQATDFINKFGDEAAQKAVEAGDIDGGMAASVLAQLQIRNSHEMADFPEGSDERDALAKKQSDLINLMEKKGYLGGEFNGQLAHEYQNAELDFANVKKQVEQLTKKPLTAGQEKKIKEVTTENEMLKAKLQEAEAKLIEETDKAFESGKEAAKTETNTEKAKRIANKLRDNAKLNKPGIFSAATPASLIWDGAIEVTAKTIETGGKLADAIEAGIKHIKDSDWYKNLPANKKALAEKEFKRVNYEHSGSTDVGDLQERFVDKTDNKFTPNEAKDIWGYMKKTYIENGTSYRDALSKTSEDLGLSWRQVSEAVTTPKVKRMSDEMWKRQSEYTRNRTAIKNWIGDQNKSAAGKALQKISGLFRGVAVFGHGGIFVGTHAGMTVFNPSMWNKTIPAFFRGWKFAYKGVLSGNHADYMRSIEELKNSPNYLIAERAGLKNNPERINTEEYQKNQHFLGRLGLAGERGFNAIKVLRQDLFDYHFNKLTPAERDDPEVAKSIAHLVNLATGATNLNIPAWVNEVSFAGGMEASRWEKLTASPVKATTTALNAILNPSKASTADRVFAKVWARRVGEQLATYSSLLLANAAIQNSIHPKNPVNMTNPNKPDFMKFKFGTVTIDPTSGMRSTAMFMRKLGEIPFQSKKELHGDKRLAAAGKDVANYARGKLAPLYATGADLFTGTDFNGNPLPYNKEKPGKGHHQLTWLEYAWSKSPLPVAEAANVAYKSAEEHGANKMTLDKVLNGIMSGGISGTTGFRVSEYDADAPENKKKK